MKFTILQFDSLPSTNTEAANQARIGADEGLCVVARQQTQGRGRRERTWHSPPDAGIYFSAVLRPKIKNEFRALLTLAAAIAVHEAILTVSDLQTDIKWANDVYANGKKLSGILAESIDTPRGNAVIMGIGINLTKNAVAPELAEIAVSIESETGIAPSASAVLEALTANLRKYYQMLHETDGNVRICQAWTARSSYAFGKKVKITLENEILHGTTRGLNPDGALLLETDNKIIKAIYAGDVVAVRSPEKL